MHSSPLHEKCTVRGYTVLHNGEISPTSNSNGKHVNHEDICRQRTPIVREVQETSNRKFVEDTFLSTVLPTEDRHLFVVYSAAGFVRKYRNIEQLFKWKNFVEPRPPDKERASRQHTSPRSSPKCFHKNCSAALASMPFLYGRRCAMPHLQLTHLCPHARFVHTKISDKL